MADSAQLYTPTPRRRQSAQEQLKTGEEPQKSAGLQPNVPHNPINIF